MLYIDGINLRYLIDELNTRLKDKRVSRIIQYDNLSLSMLFGKENLYFSTNPNLPIVYIKDGKDIAPEKPLSFSLSLKRFLISATLVKIEQLNSDRIIVFYFSKLDELGETKEYKLLVELTGKHSNIFILDKENKILDLLKKFSLEESSLRLLLPNAPYEQPIVTEKMNYKDIDEETFEKIVGNLSMHIEGFGKFTNEKCTNYEIFKNLANESANPTIYYNDEKILLGSFVPFEKFELNQKMVFETCHDMINYYTEKTVSNNFISTLKKELEKALNNRIKKHEKILVNLKKDQSEADKFDRYKELGDILAANLYAIKGSKKSVELYDFYKEQDVIIELNEKLSPQANLDTYYKRYNKGKRGITHAIQREITIAGELEYYNSLKFYLEKAESIEVLKELKDEFIDSNLITKKKDKSKVKKAGINPPSIEIDGFKIYFGRNNKENEYITFKIASGNDLWFHIKDLPGSHVIIKTQEELIPEEIIYEAAKISANNSKVNSNNRVQIDYCPKKFVKKPKGSPIGSVIYSNAKSILVDI